jgi:hypothetical protein
MKAPAIAPTIANVHMILKDFWAIGISIWSIPVKFAPLDITWPKDSCPTNKADGRNKKPKTPPTKKPPIPNPITGPLDSDLLIFLLLLKKNVQLSGEKRSVER